MGRRTARKATNNPYPRDLPANQFEPARFDAQQQNPPRQQRPLPRDFMYIDDNMHYDPVSDTYREIPNPPPQQRNPPRDFMYIDDNTYFDPVSRKTLEYPSPPRRKNAGRKQTDAQRLQRSIDNFINERVEERVEEIRRNFSRNNATSYRRYSADSDG